MPQAHVLGSVSPGTVRRSQPLGELAEDHLLQFAPHQVWHLATI